MSLRVYPDDVNLVEMAEGGVCLQATELDGQAEGVWLYLDDYQTGRLVEQVDAWKAVHRPRPAIRQAA